MVYNNQKADSARGNTSTIDLSSLSDKTIQIQHFKSDTFQKTCIDSASKWIVVNNYSNTHDIQNGKLFISPNPARENELLQITGNSIIQKVNLYMMNGQKLAELMEVAPNKFQLPNAISKSMYLIEIKSNQGNTIRKFIIH